MRALELTLLALAVLAASAFVLRSGDFGLLDHMRDYQEDARTLYGAR